MVRAGVIKLDIFFPLGDAQKVYARSDFSLKSF